MLWHIIKYYMSFVIAIFFKRTKVSNIKNIQVKGPVILAMNHPNAFMDPSAFSALVYPPRVRYLARGDAFKKGVVTWLLQSLGIIPIFRIQDGGKEGLKKNDETYNIVNRLLRNNKKIIIYAEGLCIQERRLRPLKKGVPRMIFGAMVDQNLKNLTVVPVGVNYSNPSQFRGDLFFNIGEPILVNDYLEAYKEAPAKTMNVFLADLTVKMKELIVHINHHSSEKVIKHLEIILKHDFIKNRNLDATNLEHDFLLSTSITQTINKTEDIAPEKVLELTQKTSDYLTKVKKHKLKDWLINPANKPKLNYFFVFINCLIITLTFPIYIVGLIGNYLPYKITYLFTSKKVKMVEFKASFYMGFGCVLFLLNYIMILIVSNLIVTSGWTTLLIILIFLLCGYICLYLSPLRKKTMGMIRFLQLKSKSPNAINDLVNSRKEIIEYYNSL